MSSHLARPSAGRTPDGRPLAEVRSYARRGSRLSPTRQEAWDAHASAWVVPHDEVLRTETLDRARWFGREAPLVVEVGSGTGEVAAAVAAARPEVDVLALEVWRPGVAQTLVNLERAGVGNVRVLSLDATWVVGRLLAPASVSELLTFFPDPWHKKRHHKRRLVSSDFAGAAASRLRPGGLWRLATDWPAYAEHVDAVLTDEPLLEGGRCERWAGRPLTKFERRAHREGRSVTDFCYRRVTG